MDKRHQGKQFYGPSDEAAVPMSTLEARSTLHNDVDIVADRARDAFHMTDRIRNELFGPTPSDANCEGVAKEPSTIEEKTLATARVLQNTLDTLHDIIGRLS